MAVRIDGKRISKEIKEELKEEVKQFKEKGKHIITGKIEHHAILQTCEWLERQGFEVTYLDVDENGRINPADVEALSALKYDDKLTVAEMLQEKILTIGENIKIRRFARFEGNVATYIHGGGRIGVVVNFDSDVASNDGFGRFAKNIAMQVAAANPTYVKKEDVPAEVIDKEKEILMAQAINEGKPQNIAEKMVNGRIGKYYKEVCLEEQEYIIDTDLSVNKYVEQTAKEFGGSIKIKEFVRFEKGEGLEKREDNFAEEVASMSK